ncbi:hypothetical protein BGZ72_003892 [Mortierella alpina]|nr:hypothetical protein BGZ72_003892 [Mortierella alpina]
MQAVTLLLTLQLAFLALAQPGYLPEKICDMSKRTFACHHATEDNPARREIDYYITKAFSERSNTSDTEGCRCQSDVALYNQRGYVDFDSMNYVNFKKLCDERPNYMVSTCLKYKSCERNKSQSNGNIRCHKERSDNTVASELDDSDTVVVANLSALDSHQLCSCDTALYPHFFGRSFLEFSAADPAFSLENVEQFKAQCLAVTGREIHYCHGNEPSKKKEAGPSQPKPAKRRKHCPASGSKE